MGSSDEGYKKPKTLKHVLSRFAENTSISGLPHFQNAKRTVGKVFWGVLVTVGFIAMFVHLYFLFAEFLSWPKKTTISLGFNNLHLPAITLCNVNTIRKSRLSLAADKLQKFANKIDPKNLLADVITDYVDVDYYDYIYGVEGSGDGAYIYDYEEYNDENAKENGFLERDKLSEIFTNFRGLYLNESRSTRVAMGHDFNKTLINCAFNGYKCYAENFTLYQTPKYGNCYTLDMDSFVIRKPGPRAGLSLSLYLETHEYLPGVTDGYGLRVNLHAPNTVPFPEETGFFLPGGQESSIALKQTKITRIGKPYGTCATDDEFILLYNKSYNRQACLFLCKTTLTLQKCGCYDPLNAEVLISGESSKKECTSQSELICMIKTSIQLTKKILICDCPDPCTENSYYQSLTSRQWPTNDYAALLRKTVCHNFPQDDDCTYLTLSSEESLRRNFVKLTIYYEELNFQSIKEEPDIGNAQFASDFGGAIGLWIGLSVLSMCEIFYLCGLIGGHYMRLTEQEQPRKHKKGNRKRACRDLRYSSSPFHRPSPHTRSQKDWSWENPDTSSYSISHLSEPFSPGGNIRGKRINTSGTRMLGAVLEDSDYYDGEYRKPNKMPYKYDMNDGYPHRRW